jgi:LPS-assembly lipoprotein
MSWCDPAPTKQRHLTVAGRFVVVALLTAGLLSGCADGGFRPMYAPTASGVGAQERLAAMDIAPIPGRVGQRIRNELIFESTGGGAPPPPQFRLEITIKEALNSSLVKSTGEALSQIYNLDANFKLVRLSDRQVLMQGASHARAEFERFQQIYANVRAREDAETRASRQIAEDIKTRLATFLSRDKV